ncbi:phosphotransferase [Amycolatopsis nigrescens]|uniref:phosphotransferase n=1 Tax=Amycolatopsis nigrescens TaxID=381445 RepID=UPI0003624153|nr:phosphotransferase [Amycolatopsis nigrescens]
MSEIDALTQSDLTARTSRAIAAAAGAARDLGLEVTGTEVLHDSFSVVVRLEPLPVVVRVPTVLPEPIGSDLAAQAARQRVELDVVGRLADLGHPVVAPSPLVPREPVQRDGFSMTFWQFVEQDKCVEPDYVRNSGLTAGLHAALREYTGELPFLATMVIVPTCLSQLENRPDLLAPSDLDRAKREWEILEPVLGSRAGFEAAFPGVELQPIHGDSPPFNLIVTTTGALYADFEDATLGPVEWDLALTGPEGEKAYNTAAGALGLRSLDDRVLRVMEAARMLQLVACLTVAPKMPTLLEGLQPSLDFWRGMPLAGGFGG